MARTLFRESRGGTYGFPSGGGLAAVCSLRQDGYHMTRATFFSGKFHVSYGGGLRYFIDRKTGMVIRADCAFVSDAGGTYFSFGEAF